MSEKDCEYVSSRGLLKSCDLYIDPPKSSTGDLPNLNNVSEYCSIYVCNAAIDNLVKNIDKINNKFVLVSGDADEEVYNQLFHSKEDFLKFIENNKIIHWFSQNSTVSHPKMTNLPIGLAYHTPGESKMPLEQEELLIKFKNESAHYTERQHKCYINFSSPPAFYHYVTDRLESLDEIPKELCFKEIENQNKYVCWENQTKYAFVISPFGNGLDCHRTWEALILGCIPIVRSSGMNPLFDDLPVLIIEKWSDVTQDLLDSTIEKFKNRSFNYDKLLLKYWVDKINSYKKTENFTTNIHNQNKVSYEYIIYFVLIFFLIVFSFIFLYYFGLLRKFKNIIIKAIHRK